MDWHFLKIKFFSTSENNSVAVVVLHPCKTSRGFKLLQASKGSYGLSVEKFLFVCRNMYTDVKLHRELRLAELH